MPVGTLKLERLVLANSEDLADRPYRIRTCDTLIKRYKRYVPEREKK